MEIHEISSFEYGDHGELVPIQKSTDVGAGAVPPGPQSHYQDTYRWKNEAATTEHARP